MNSTEILNKLREVWNAAKYCGRIEFDFGLEIALDKTHGYFGITYQGMYYSCSYPERIIKELFDK